MKFSTISALLFSAVATAQNMSVMTSSSTSTYTTCTDMPDVTLTSTNTVTVTYCSSCDMGGNTVHTTVYTTVYTDVCPEPPYTTQNTYTVTESCSGMTPSWSSGPSYVPQGFTTTEFICTMCGSTPVTASMTYPTASPPAVLGTNAAATPAAASMTGAAATPTDTSVATTPAAGGDTAVAQPTATPAAWGNTTGITPYQPGANGAGMPSMSLSAAMLAAALVAGGAFLL